MGKAKRISVLLADDHPVVREGVRSCLAASAHVKVVGEAADGLDLVAKAKQLRPDVVLMDINLPALNGLRATEQLQREVPSVKVLALSAHRNRDYLHGMVAAGAKGYVMKEASPAELIEAIQTVYRGERYFSRCLMSDLMDALAKENHQPARRNSFRLSPRECEVLALIAEGLTNKDISVRLNVTLRTIETHRERIMDKLEIRNVAGLTRYAVAQGLVSMD